MLGRWLNQFGNRKDYFFCSKRYPTQINSFHQPIVLKGTIKHAEVKTALVLNLLNFTSDRLIFEIKTVAQQVE